MNGKRHEIVITELDRVRTCAEWVVELFTGHPISTNIKESIGGAHRRSVMVEK
jgi:hypothetical protein